MRRLMFITAFALLLTLPALAQRGGGGHPTFSGRGVGPSVHSGFSGGHTGGHFFNGMRSSPGFHRGTLRTSHPAPFRSSVSRDRFPRGNRFHNGFGNRFRTHRFRNNCFGFGCWGSFGYPWWYAGYWDPWWWDSHSSYDEDYDRDLAVANEMNEQSLEQQRMLRQEEADGDRDDSAGSNSTQRPESGQQADGASIAPTVLVFRDQRKQEIWNYAIVGQTLWNFSSHRTEKIPLSELDLTATINENDDRGVAFRIPANNEAQ